MILYENISSMRRHRTYLLGTRTIGNSDKHFNPTRTPEYKCNGRGTPSRETSDNQRDIRTNRHTNNHDKLEG